MQEPTLELYPGHTLANRALTWWAATRPAFFTASVLPMLVALAWVWHEQGHLQGDLALLALGAVVLIHAAANVFNDYYDALNGTDMFNSGRIFPFSGGSRFIQNEVLGLTETRILATTLLSGAVLLGLWAVWLSGPILLLFGLTGGLLAIFYSAPPCLACRGLGDITIALSFGVLPVTGTVWMQSGAIPPAAIWLGLSTGLFTAAILWVNSIPDIDADLRAGKHTLPARLGADKAPYGLAVLFVLSFLLIAPLPTGSGLALLGILPAGAAVYHLFHHRLSVAIRLTLLTHTLSCGALAAGLAL